MYHDESGVSVIIGTLMMILITITAASGLALMVSGMQKDAMERESHLAAVASENLRIIAIDPVGDDTHWHSVNVTIMNLNTADSRITAISLNGKHARNYMANGASGDLECYKRYPSYPVVYNFNKRVVISATGSKEICLNFTEIVVNTSEVIDVSGWINNSTNYDNRTNYNFSLSNHPRVAYPDVNYFENVSDSNTSFNRTTDYTMDYPSGSITLLALGNMSIFQSEIINVSDWTNNATNYTAPRSYSPIKDGSENVSNSSISFNRTTDYEMNYTTGNITLLASGNMRNNTGNYNISYINTTNTSYNIKYTTQFDTFPPPGSMSVYGSKSLPIEVITSLINIFKRTFMPPVPLAEVQFETERLVNSSGSVSYPNYLILDASDSFDPDDGFITEYKWAVRNDSTQIYGYDDLTGMKVRPVGLNLSESHEIDLEVRDDTGMVSKLSQRSGNITIP